jgi:DNA-binding MarR family transcriptional regulator
MVSHIIDDTRPMPRTPATKPPPPARADAPSDVRGALDALRLIVQALRLGAREGRRRAGLSSAQLFALQRIAENPRASINDLAALTFTHQSSVSVVIQRLVDQGLVAKVAASDDRRRQLLALTARGRRALQRAPAPVQDRLVDAIAALSPPDRRRLAKSLNAIACAVVPGRLAPHPPMLFEDSAPRRRKPSRAMTGGAPPGFLKIGHR